MVLYAAVADYTAGRWMHGAQGDELCLQAQLRMQALGVAAPASFVRMLTPAR
ncbi:MAG: hypothetical protein RLZZ450_5272 [Pseudomonadota bacterium]